MNTSYFHDFIFKNTDIEPALLSELLSQCKTMHLQKGEFATKQGEASLQSFYVQKGLMRYYSVDDKGKEHILQFAPEGWFLTDRQSGFVNSHSDFFIDALEDSELLIVNDDFLLDLAKKNDAFLTLNNRLLHNHVRSLQNRIDQLLSYTAEQRYISFVRTYPDILLRVPQAMVASYLGITPESLSRVRRELAQRNKP